MVFCSKHTRILTVFSLVLLTQGLLLPFAPTVQGAQLSQASVRFDRMASNTSLSGIVCATPSGAGVGTEGRIAVTFPSDFSISNSSTDWNTGTSNLPSGSTSWPGISSSALSVSGSTVTFSGGDLLSGSANYCFSFIGANSTTGAQGAKNGTVTTLTSGGSPIDTSSYGTTITKDRIGVSVTVPASPTDFTAALNKLTSGSTYGEDTTVEYELTYGSKLAYTSPITVEASWSLGTISGAGSPTVELLDYESGSAGNAHNNAPPVIDVINRKITWTIPSFPANTTKSVRFSVRTNASYTGASPVTFQVSGRVLGPGTATSYSTVTSTYLFNYRPTQQPGPTSTPGLNTSAPSPTSQPTSTDPLTITDVDLRTITAESATIAVTTSDPASLSVSFGTSPGALSQRITSLNHNLSQIMSFSTLKPNTTYFLRITATDRMGRRVTSDLYTFTTAISSSPVAISLDSLIVTSDKNIIFVPAFRGETGGKNVIIVPPDRAFEIQLGLLKTANIKQITLIVRPKVLAVNNLVEGEVESSTESVPMIEIKQGIFTGRLQSKTKPGYSEVYTRIEDYNGNITEEKLADLKVSRPFLVLQKANKKAVENAKVTLEYFNEKKRMYEFISSQTLPITNPSYTDAEGQVPVVLPIGQYRATIEDFLYEKETVTFTIGSQPDEDYPTVYLTAAPFSILRSANYILKIGSDITSTLQDSISRILGSRRMFDITSFLIAISFTGLTLFALSQKMHVSLRRLPFYFTSLLHLHRAPEEHDHLYHGVVIDGHSKAPLPGVDIFIIDRDSSKVVFHTKSKDKGTFSVMLPPQSNYSVMLEKVSYHATTCELSLLKKDESQTFAILQTDSLPNPLESARLVIQRAFSFSFELFLLASLVISLLLIPTFGFLPVFPFLALALFNMVFWMLHSIHVKS